MVDKSEEAEKILLGLRNSIQNDLYFKREVSKDLPGRSTMPFLEKDQDLGTLLQIKLRLESEIEAVQKANIYKLPNNNTLLLEMAKEHTSEMLNNNKLCLEVFKSQNHELEETKERWIKLITQAESLRNKLREIKEKQTKQDKLQALSQRHELNRKIFGELREELFGLIQNQYKDYAKELNEILRDLVLAFRSSSNDPYIDITNISESMSVVVKFLITRNVASLDPDNINNLRLVDPLPY